MSTADYFKTLYQQADPFRYRSRWYEARKRALTLACLPQQRYAKAWEAGCSNGVLTAELASRCDALLATDLSAEALASAAVSTRDHPHVTLQQATHPQEWPAGQFDLIVLSELGYYLPEQTLHIMAARLQQSLSEDGLLLACHWLPPFDEARCSTAQVHKILSAGLVEAFRYHDEDMLLQGWSTGSTSVARMEGLR